MLFKLRSSAVLRLRPITSTNVSVSLLTGLAVSHYITVPDIDELIKDTGPGVLGRRPGPRYGPGRRRALTCATADSREPAHTDAELGCDADVQAQAARELPRPGPQRGVERNHAPANAARRMPRSTRAPGPAREHT
jgi:hypothetical protein